MYKLQIFSFEKFRSLRDLVGNFNPYLENVFPKNKGKQNIKFMSLKEDKKN